MVAVAVNHIGELVQLTRSDIDELNGAAVEDFR